MSKERRGGHRCWEKQDMDKNWLEPTWPKMVEDSPSSRLWASLYTHYNILVYAKGHTHQCHDKSEADHKRPEVGSGPIPGKPLPSSKIVFLYKVTVFLVSMKLLLLLFSRSVVSDSLQPHGLQASLSFTVFWSLLRLMSIESVMLSDHLILGHTLLLLPSIFPSIKVFPNDLALPIRWPKYWNFSFSISPSSEYSGLISIKIDWFDLLAVQRTLKSLQYHNSKAWIFWCSALFMAQL